MAASARRWTSSANTCGDQVGARRVLKERVLFSSSGASVAGDVCYTSGNKRGDQYGHCGTSASNFYIGCTDRWGRFDWAYLRFDGFYLAT